MIVAETSEYTDHPIYLHILNRELHDAIRNPVDFDEILTAIQIFSVVSSQTIFCNVSQIHEVLYNRSDILEEILELSKIGRFVDHSDYGSYEEFRESRAEKFSHSAHLHPGFFVEPRPELKRLLHGSMGGSISTTGHIEENLSLWIENDDRSALSGTLSQNDARVLRANEDWLDRTLRNRDQKALTFDVFAQNADGVIGQQAEGAVRRSLTELYIDNYVRSFDARCLWGFRGKNHFERTKLLAGLHQHFAAMVLEQVGLMDSLKKTRNFGRFKRISSDGQDEAAHFRQGYALFARAIDSKIEDPFSWHHCNMVVGAAIQQTRSSGVLRPQRTSFSYKDLLMRAGDTLIRASERSQPTHVAPPNILQRATTGARDVNIVTTVHSEGTITDQSCHTMTLGSPNPPIWKSYVLLVALGSIGIGIACFLALPAFFNSSLQMRIVTAIAASIVGGGAIYWFHPDFFYRRMALLGLSTALVGGLSYKFQLGGWIEEMSGSLEVGNLPSIAMIIGGLLFAVVSLFLDFKVRSGTSAK